MSNQKPITLVPRANDPLADLTDEQLEHIGRIAIEG